jgi:sugar phosphate permease
MASSSAIASDGREAGSETGIAVIRKVAWRLMPLIMICYLFAFFDRINISFAKFQLQGDLGLSDTAYGLGASLCCSKCRATCCSIASARGAGSRGS